MKIFICGQRSFGKAVLKALYEAGHEITGVAPAPQKRLKDKMVGYALLKGIPVISDCDRLSSSDVPDGTELVISAHSHWMISDKILDKCKFGGIGFHPSLLPRHRGQDAVRWAIHMGDGVTGASVYNLRSPKCDAGDVMLREIVFIKPGWDYHELWSHIFPIGVRMMCDAVKLIEEGKARWEPQDEEAATWEPSWERARLKRNELLMLGGDAGDAELDERCVGCTTDCRFCPHKK